MGGGNAQKSAAARLKNLKDKGPTDEERAASKAKSEKDKAGYKCSICLQTFMISTKPSGLFLHVKSKHDKEIATPEKCFPALKGFDPANPDVARRRPALGPRAARARSAGGGRARAADERRQLA
ncbi:hypothetical protein JL722_10604 [Aureococcus anophagefferens]|nr:hypothetical protein JL722_10604 [Aureococcus anophagefferens]